MSRADGAAGPAVISPIWPILVVALLTGAGCGRSPPAPVASARAASDASIPADPPAGETSATRGTEIALVYSSNVEGEYEHCGCPSHPIGGLARRATIIDQARAEADGVLIVDAGDLLLPPQPSSPTPPATRAPTGPAAPTSEIERRARLLFAAYAAMGVQAVLPAERDLAIGVDKLKRLMKAAGVPAVASNLVGRDGRPIFERDRLVTVAGVPIGIFGVVAPQPADQTAWRTWHVRATDPVAAARDEVASLRARGARMIVALVHVGQVGAARRLLGDVRGITWAVQGHAAEQLETPETLGDGHLVEAFEMGRVVGRLDIHIVDGNTASFRDRGERAQLLTIVADHRRQLADIEARAAADKTSQLRDYYQLRREGLGAAIAREVEVARKLPAAVAGSWYENRIIPLDASIPDQRAVAMLVGAYNEENARRAAAGLPVGIAPAAPAATALPPSPSSARAKPPKGSSASPAAQATDHPTTYAGSAACAGCHATAWRVFETTKHAHALAALARVGRDRDPTCVGCHVTGYLLPGGTRSLRIATDQLKDVGCESCHGPSLAHVTAVNKKATTQRQVAETVCRGCHTPDRTNGEFEYRSFLKAVLGPGHGA